MSRLSLIYDSQARHPYSFPCSDFRSSQTLITQGDNSRDTTEASELRCFGSFCVTAACIAGVAQDGPPPRFL